MRKCAVFFLLCVMVLSFGAVPASAAKYDWRLASEELADSAVDLYAHEFARLLKEKSNGDIQLEVFPHGTLGTPTEMFELALNGAVEFCLIAPGQCSSIIPENQIFLLHFLFSMDDDKNAEFLRKSKAINEKLGAVYESKGLKVLNFFNEGAMYWTANKPLRKPEDFEGVKFRVMPSELLLEIYKAYGASPTAVSFNEVYSGLQLHIIDGQENPPYVIQEMKYMDVQKCLIASKHNIFVMQHLANLNFFNGLPEDIKRIVVESAAEAYPYVNKVQKEMNAQRLDMMVNAFKKDQALVELTQEEFNAFREIAKKADGKYFELSRNPEFARELLQEFRQEMAAIEGK